MADDEKIEAFCSFDVEADGTNPLEHSMRSLGVGLFTDSGLIDTFYKTIVPQKQRDGSLFGTDPLIMRDFWQKHPKQWKEINTSAQEPSTVMFLFSRWLDKHQKKYIIKWVSRPSNCDWMWLKSYYEFYGPPKKPTIGHYCHDLSSLLRAYILCHNIMNKKAFIHSLSDGSPYTHNALDDAICQGKMYMNLRNLLKKPTRQNVAQQVIQYKGNIPLLITVCPLQPSTDPESINLVDILKQKYCETEEKTCQENFLS